jgi:hypothetical protein
MLTKFDLYNKKGMVMMMLSRELLTYALGDRIDTISSYTKRFNTSRGVVQEVLNILEDEKAITRSKRGTLGTYLTKIDYKKLWEFTSWGVLTGVSPLPYTKKHEGIATAIYEEIEKRSIPFHFAYMQGAENRIRGILEEKYDFAVLGKESANKLIKKYKDLSIAMEFAPFSYLSGYVVLYKDKNVLKKKVLRIGRDLDSPDHVKLLELLSENREVEFIDIQYTRMIPAIINGTIDVTVYNKDTIEKPEILGNIYFEEFVTNKNIGDETRAVLVINNKSYGVLNLLKQIIHKEQVNMIQKEVIEDKRVPIY